MLRSAAFALALLPGLATATADDHLPFTCRAELDQLDVNLRTSEVHFDDAWVANDPALKCVAIRQHVEVMRDAVAVYTRCLSGKQREDTRGQALRKLANSLSIVDEMFCQ